MLLSSASRPSCFLLDGAQQEERGLEQRFEPINKSVEVLDIVAQRVKHAWENIRLDFEENRVQRVPQVVLLPSVPLIAELLRRLVALQPRLPPRIAPVRLTEDVEVRKGSATTF